MPNESDGSTPQDHEAELLKEMLERVTAHDPAWKQDPPSKSSSPQPSRYPRHKSSPAKPQK